MKKIYISTLLLATLLLANNELVIGENNSKTLSIYNNIAFMQEYQTVDFNKKVDTIIYKNIPSSIITDSINIINDDINILTQQYFYNKPTIYNILKANIGKEVNFYLNYKKYTSFQFKKGILLSINNSTSLVQDNNFIYSIPNNQIQIKKLPNNIYINPFLKWNLSSNKIIKNSKLQLNYLLKNIYWNSEYNVYLINDNEMKLNGWFNIKNNSGINFNNIKINIIAGKVNKTNHFIKKHGLLLTKSFNKKINNISEKSEIGLKKYVIPFKVFLKNNQNTQINFINTTLQYKLINKFTLLPKNYNNFKAKQYINFNNTTNHPLPKGNIRFYKNIFLGSNKINNISKNMKISLYINNNYDLYLNNTFSFFKKKKKCIIQNKIYKNCYYYKINTNIINNSDKKQKVSLFFDFKHFYNHKKNKIFFFYNKTNNDKFIIKFKIEKSFNLISNLIKVDY